MIKNIILGLLSFLLVFFVVYANIKAQEAEKQVIEAQLNLRLAEENALKAKEVEEKSVIAVTLAKKEVEELKRQLENCK